MITTGTRTAAVAVLLLGTAATALPLHAEVTVSSAATTNMICANGLCAPTAKDAVLNAGDLETLLASGNVDISTTGSGVQADDIRIDAPFGRSASSTLTLDAYESISVEKTVAISGQGGLAVTTNDGGSGGVFSFGPKGHITFANASSALTIGGISYMLVTTLPALASAVAANPSGAYALASSYNAAQDGPYTAAPIATPFTGSFNGLGNVISYMKITSTSKATYLGLFANVEALGNVDSIHLAHVEIRAIKQSYIGSIAGLSYGTVFNVFASGKIDAPAGQNGGAIIGGGVGINWGAVSKTAAAMKVKMGSKASGTAVEAGGLVGLNGGSIDQSYATGPVAVTGTAEAVIGGLVAFSPGMIKDCYAEGAATEGGAGDAAVGGLVGLTYMTVEDSFSTGAPAGGNGSLVGGFVGDDDHSVYKGMISRDYWDLATSGIEKHNGAGNIPNDPGIKGRTTEQLQSGLPKGFDPKIWAENPKINNGLPYLIDNPPQ